jgi:hypothetical protein
MPLGAVILPSRTAEIKNLLDEHNFSLPKSKDFSAMGLNTTPICDL